MPRPVLPGTPAGGGRGDVIDVEVIWEEAEDLATRPMAPRAGRAHVPPLRLASPGAAIAAYRSSSTTRDQPHQRVDIFA